jgi:hypothetical protein
MYISYVIKSTVYCTELLNIGYCASCVSRFVYSPDECRTGKDHHLWWRDAQGDVAGGCYCLSSGMFELWFCVSVYTEIYWMRYDNYIIWLGLVVTFWFPFLCWNYPGHSWVDFLAACDCEEAYELNANVEYFSPSPLCCVTYKKKTGVFATQRSDSKIR